ncbi:MAG: DUF1540 domain-containing protein [Bacillota bacterium]|jgi:hypothetical protein|nr:DUF1540 domain-containing protein [Candidatus Fermentithermobacillaceae bacterium]
MTDVKCKVSSCHYWGHGDICQADSIMVDYNNRQSFGMEVGSLDVGDRSGKSSVTTGNESATKSEETLCKTFRPKENQPRH